MLLPNVNNENLNKLKSFLEDVLQKLPNDSFVLTPLEISNFIEGAIEVKKKA